MNRNTAMGRLGGVIHTILAVVGGLTIVLCITAAIFYVGFRPQGTIKIKETKVAPGAQHVATLYVGTGGGAAGWCYQIVAVNTSTSPFSPKSAKDSLADNVFRGACSLKVRLKWLTSSKLQIDLPNLVSDTWASSDLRNRNNTGDVKIVYVFGAEKALPPVGKVNAEAGKE